nr:hypothetical protein [uncultured Psychroserpens sp.]
MNQKKIINIVFYLGLIIFCIVLFRRCNQWHERLTSDNGKLTVAHVFTSNKVKSTTYYHYAYKVGDNYFSESTSGSNVSDFKNHPIQCFLVAYDQTDPSVHTVIWSYKFDSIIPIGEQISGIQNKNELIKKHTVGWNGLSPCADKNDWDKIKAYDKLKQQGKSIDTQ